MYNNLLFHLELQIRQHQTEIDGTMKTEPVKIISYHDDDDDNDDNDDNDYYYHYYYYYQC